MLTSKRAKFLTILTILFTLSFQLYSLQPVDGKYYICKTSSKKISSYQSGPYDDIYTALANWIGEGIKEDGFHGIVLDKNILAKEPSKELVIEYNFVYSEFSTNFQETCSKYNVKPSSKVQKKFNSSKPAEAIENSDKTSESKTKEQLKAEEKAEKERIKAEEKAEKERKAAELKAEKEKKAAEAKAEKERKTAEAKVEKERKAAEKKSAEEEKKKSKENVNKTKMVKAVFEPDQDIKEVPETNSQEDKVYPEKLESELIIIDTPETPALSQTSPAETNKLKEEEEKAALIEAEKLAAEKAEEERLEKERLEQEKLKKEQEEKARIEKELKEAEEKRIQEELQKTIQEASKSSGIYSRYQKEYLQDYMKDEVSELPVNEETEEEQLIQNPDAVDSDGQTLLMKAAKSGNEWQLRLLIKSGADMNIKDKDGWTALMYAVRYQESAEAVNMLLSGNTDVKAKNNYDSTALLMAACYNSNPEILRKLLTYYSTSEKEVVKAFVQLLSTSQMPEYVQIAKIKIFLEKSIQLNTFYEGKTPLMYAAQYANSTKIIKLLLDSGCLTTVRSTEGKTAFEYATKNTKLKHDDYYWALNQK